MRKLFLLVLIMMATSCNVASNSNNQSYSYELTENFCSTGKQSFSTKDDMCLGLQNNAQNNNCAINSRRDYFISQSCTGTFTAGLVSRFYLINIQY